MRIRMMLVVAALLTVAGCSTNPSRMGVGEVRNITDKLTYIKDARTNQCFAAVAARQSGDPHQSGFTITWVPCTPEVEKQIAGQ